MIHVCYNSSVVNLIGKLLDCKLILGAIIFFRNSVDWYQVYILTRPDMIARLT